MIKKALSLALALALSIGLAIPALAASTFSDVPENNWAYPYIEKAAENGWISGYTDGRFGPNDKVTYAQFCVMLIGAFFPEQLEEYNGPADSWYSRQCGTAAELGLFEYSTIKGRHTDATAVGENLSRYEMAAILYPAFETAVKEVDDDALGVVEATTPDWSSIPEVYKTSVAVAKTYGLINGVDAAGAFSGNGTMNRAQAAVVLCKFHELIQNRTISLRIEGTVTRVVDGDTIVVNFDGKEETVRLIGVDTPESVHPIANKNTEAGFAASEFTTVYLSGKKVNLEFDVQERDQYGRLLAYVYVDGKMFNEKLLQTGYASIATYPPNVKYVDRFTEIEKNRDHSVPSGEYDDGYMKAPSIIYKTSAKENGLEDSFYYEDGIVDGIENVSGHKIVVLETDHGNVAIIEIPEIANIYNLKKGDSVRIGFLYIGYSDVTKSPAGAYMETLKRVEEEKQDNTQVQSRTVYVTKTGKRYHYDGNCNGGKYYASTLNEAKSRGLTPCNKCVH